MVMINIEKRHLYLLFAVLIFLLGVGFVFSMTAGVAPNPGHTLNDISAPPECSAGQILSWTGSDWNCIDRGITCRWVDMRMITTKPNGEKCASGNAIAYITLADANQDGVAGYCRYTQRGKSRVIYGYLELINKEYDGEDIVRCANSIFTSSIGTNSECGVNEGGIAQYMVCD